jgi:hypothetical protein
MSKTALERVISLHRDPVGERREWMVYWGLLKDKRGLWQRSVSLYDSSANLEGGSITGDPEVYAKVTV